jgi:HD-GYP domain-containing protein (c-di-GMP phosphodiesterase class II)
VIEQKQLKNLNIQLERSLKIKMTNVLETRLNGAFDKLEILQPQRDSLTTLLNLVKLKDIPTWQHEVRVGLMGIKIAEYTHLMDPKALFYPGLVHDTGKGLTDLNSLQKTEGFDEKDMTELRKHVLDGYRIVKGIHDFSAEVLKYHHWFQDEGYPKILPEPDIDFSKGTNASILFYARILSLIDFHDAMMFRKNDKLGKSSVPIRDKGKSIIIEANPDQKYFLEQLYKAKIF